MRALPERSGGAFLLGVFQRKMRELPGRRTIFWVGACGVSISDSLNALKAGTRGPLSLKDLVLRDTIHHFDHERILERIVLAVKMEADRGYPQAASTHDTFWGFIGLMPEASHLVMWQMVDGFAVFCLFGEILDCVRSTGWGVL